MTLSTKQIADHAATIADLLAALDVVDVERVFKVVRALRGQPEPVALDPVIVPFLQPAQPPPYNPWPLPADFHFQIHSGFDPTACAPSLPVGDVWVGEIKGG